MSRLARWLGRRRWCRSALAWVRTARHDVPSATVGGLEGHEVVRLLSTPDEARAFLRRDAPLWAWPLCTLAARDWPFVRLWTDDSDGVGRVAAVDPAGGTPGRQLGPTPTPTPSARVGAGAGPAGVWIFDHPSWGGSVQAFGDAVALARILPKVALPGRAFVRAVPAAEALVAARYRFDWFDSIVRMHVTPDTLAAPPTVARVERLGQADAHALAALYAIWPESRFQPSRLRQGYQYVGIRHGGRIVAAAEHLLVAREEALAVVQGVLVEPAYRGQGLAGAVTAALTTRLFEDGARDVVLDVRESNLAAQAAYRRIGYRPHATLLAGPGSAR